MNSYDWTILQQEFIEGDRGRGLKEFATAKGIPYQTVRLKASRDHWMERRDKFHAKLEAAKTGRRARLLSRDLAVIDDEIVRASQRLIESINTDLAAPGLQLRSVDCLNYANAIKSVQDTVAATRGDVGNALVTLVNRGIIHPQVVPFILDAFTESEIEVTEKISGLLHGAGRSD